jgi:hypothetical protein
LEVIITGERSFSETIELLQPILGEYEKNNLYKILIDLSEANGEWREFERFQLGERASQIFRPPYRMLGIDNLEKINKFAENTGVNRGAVLFVTNDRTEGLSWLLK